MKTSIIQSTALVLVFVSFLKFSKSQSIQSNTDITNSISSIIGAFKNSGNSSWISFNPGYSNNGVSGSIEANYSEGKMVFTSRYFKSHVCYKDGKQRQYFLNVNENDSHKSVESFSFLTGYVLSWKFHPTFSVGISYTIFEYESTVHIENNVTAGRILQTIIGRDYENEVRDSKVFYSVGIPVEMKYHFNSGKIVGYDVGVSADINPHEPFCAIEIGLHLGKVHTHH